MRLTRFQKIVSAATAALIVVRLFAPVRYMTGNQTEAISYIPGVWFGHLEDDYSGVWIGSHAHATRILTSATIFQVLALLVLASALCLLFPQGYIARPREVAGRQKAQSGHGPNKSPGKRSDASLPPRWDLGVRRYWLSLALIAALATLYLLSSITEPPIIVSWFMILLILFLIWLVLFNIALGVRTLLQKKSPKR